MSCSIIALGTNVFVFVYGYKLCMYAVQEISLDICSYLRDYVWLCYEAFALVCFCGFFLQPRKFKCVHVTTLGYPQKFIRENL